jgi:hypothetical protein
MKILKFFGKIGCIILIVLKWCLWIPYMIFVFPFTEHFMHEYDIVMLPSYWLDDLNK